VITRSGEHYRARYARAGPDGDARSLLRESLIALRANRKYVREKAARDFGYQPRAGQHPQTTPA